MKKLYIGLILLFVFLSFVPQIALGDLIIIPEKEEIQKVKKQYEKDLLCINEKKAHLSEKYIGTNLKPENYKNIPYIFYDLHDHPGLYKTDLSSKKQYEVDTYFNELDNFDNPIHFHFNRQEPDFGLIKQTSLVYNCKEYVMLYSYSQPEGGRVYTNITAYDVTNVPPGSYLKYISETKEFQVLSPTDKSYKKIIESQKKQLEKRNERIKAQKEQQRIIRNYKIKTTILNIIFVIGVIALLAIFVKNIVKKLKL